MKMTLEKQLMAMTAVHLKKQLQRCGLSLNRTTKAAAAESLANHYNQLLVNPLPSSLVAVDLGLSNMSICRLSVGSLSTSSLSLNLHHWSSYEVEARTAFQSLDYAREALRWVKQLQNEQQTQTIAIERQLLGLVGSSIAGNTKLLVWEAALLTALTAQQPSFNVLCMSSNSVSSLFSLSSTTAPSAAARRKEKKKRTVELVNSFLQEQHISINAPPSRSLRLNVSQNAANQWQKTSKKDDMADALLIGLSVYLQRLYALDHLRELGVDWD